MHRGTRQASFVDALVRGGANRRLERVEGVFGTLKRSFGLSQIRIWAAPETRRPCANFPQMLEGVVCRIKPQASNSMSQ